MWTLKKNMFDDLMSIEAPKKQPRSVNYQKIISYQQSVIKLLEKEIMHLRQYLQYVAGLEETFNDETTDVSITNTPKNQSYPPSEKPTKKITGLKSLINEIMKIVKANSPDELLPSIRKLQEKANQKSEPVFVEKIKEKQVPVYIQKIKEVEKIKVQEKIVYVEKSPKTSTEEPQLTVEGYDKDAKDDKKKKYKEKQKKEASRWKMMDRPKSKCKHLH